MIEIQPPIKIEKCEATTIGLEIVEGLDEQEWKMIGHTLVSCQGALQWWIGDWINYGEKAYGTKYEEAKRTFGLEAAGYGYSYETLTKFAAVSKEIEFRNRLRNLSWTHHFIVCPLPERDQKRLLKKAADRHWSVKELKQAINEERANPLAQVEQKAKFLFSDWLGEGIKWLEDQTKTITKWETARLEAIVQDLADLEPLKERIQNEIQRRKL